MSMSSPTLPRVTDEFIGKEPSLNDLCAFHLKHVDIFPNDANEDILIDYKRALSGANHIGKYYLYGQLLVKYSVPITNDLLQSAININNSRQIEYGGPCNSFEAQSIRRHEKMFLNLIEFINKYYEIGNDLGVLDEDINGVIQDT